MTEQKFTGKIARERIRRMETPRPPEGIIEGFRALGDASGIVSDVMDELGITGVIGASVLKPTMAGQSIVGPALTVRNIMQREHVYEAARRHVNKMAEFEAHNLAQPGDIVVADDTGVCFIPRDRAAEVLALAQRKSAAEEAKCKAIDSGMAVADL